MAAGTGRRLTPRFRARMELEALPEREGDRDASCTRTKRASGSGHCSRRCRRCSPAVRIASSSGSTRRGSATCTPGSGSWRSSGIFFGAGAEPGGPDPDDRPGQPDEPHPATHTPIGIEAMYRRPGTSVASPEHGILPCLPRSLKISRADRVLCADIAHVPAAQGFFCLVAVMDWATRRLFAWRLSNTMDISFCVEALDDALTWRTPEALNTDSECSGTGSPRGV